MRGSDNRPALSLFIFVQVNVFTVTRRHKPEESEDSHFRVCHFGPTLKVTSRIGDRSWAVRAMQFRFSTIWMKTLAIHILIPHFPSPNLSTFLVYRCGKVHPHKRRPTILAIQHSTQHNGSSRILGREKNDVHVAGNYRPTESMIACPCSYWERKQLPDHQQGHSPQG